MMKKSVVQSFIFLLLFTSSVLAADRIEKQEPLITVGIAVNQSMVIVAANTDFYVSENDTKGSAAFPAKNKVQISVKNGVLQINGKSVSASRLRLDFSAEARRPQADLSAQALAAAGSNRQQGHFLSVNGKRYRGLLEIRHQPGKPGFNVINTLPLEEYLYGVVPREISPSWPLEAIKAQAVAARSYAFANTGKHQDQGFEVCASSHCQVYGGRDSESDQTTKAVNETRGMMVTYGETVISAFFHASSGGYTEDSETVWGEPYPYLRGVADFDQQSPHSHWERRVTAGKLTELLRAAGYKVGTVTAIELSPLQKQPVSTADRGISGRVKKLKLVGTEGSVSLAGTKFSSLLGLPSSLFAVTAPPETAPGAQAKSAGSDKTAAAAKSVWIITGAGWGHGIGLSQWGAKGMAEKASPGDNEYYKKILTHYYANTNVQTWYK